MNLFGNAIRQWYGNLTITSPLTATSGVPLTVIPSSGLAGINIAVVSGFPYTTYTTNNGVTNGYYGIGISAGAGATDTVIRTVASKIAFSVNNGAGTCAFFDTSGNLNINNGAGISPVYAGIPQSNQDSNYTLVLADANTHILHNTAGAITYTIPGNGTVAFPVGTAITFVNATGSGVLTLAFTDTVQFYPSGGSGNRTVAANGQVTILKIASTVWSVTGVGVT